CERFQTPACLHTDGRRHLRSLRRSGKNHCQGMRRVGGSWWKEYLRVGEASDAVDAVEPIDAACASGFVSSAYPPATSASRCSCHPAWGAPVRHRLVEALREVGAVDDRGLPGRLHGATCPRPPPASRRGRRRPSRCCIPWQTCTVPSL